MENKTKLFELRKDVLVPRFNKKTGLYRLERIKARTRYFFDEKYNSKRNIVILYKKKEVISKENIKYSDCISIPRKNLDTYFEEKPFFEFKGANSLKDRKTVKKRVSLNGEDLGVIDVDVDVIKYIDEIEEKIREQNNEDSNTFK